MKNIVHLNAGVYNWSGSKSIVTNRFFENLETALDAALDAAGKGGSTTTGNTA